MYHQFVLVEFNNSAPYVAKFTSKSKIYIDRVAQHMIDNDDFNEEKDAITFVDDPYITCLDEES